jgi:1,2-dihydroxy-3-keto-5-methylthiopentene dioxygenase
VLLHTHSVNSTVLPRQAGDSLGLHGFEMQKALGNRTHDEHIELLVFDNDQDIDALAQRLEQQWRQERISQPGFLVRGHGLFVLDLADKVYALLCCKDDVISVPVNTRQWFDMGPNPVSTAIRLFNNPNGWAAQFTGNDIADRFPLPEHQSAGG